MSDQANLPAPPSNRRSLPFFGLRTLIILVASGAGFGQLGH
jgi:hypothetical protein